MSVFDAARDCDCSSAAIYRWLDDRTLATYQRDAVTTEVTLRAGENVLVFKVINEKIDWSGCARFTDRDGNVIKGLKVTTTPE